MNGIKRTEKEIGIEKAKKSAFPKVTAFLFILFLAAFLQLYDMYYGKYKEIFEEGV